jgi:hypothetical protein
MSNHLLLTATCQPPLSHVPPSTDSPKDHSVMLRIAPSEAIGKQGFILLYRP